jgi:DNA-binding Lrp family transcriptional regulator
LLVRYVICAEGQGNRQALAVLLAALLAALLTALLAALLGATSSSRRLASKACFCWIAASPWSRPMTPFFVQIKCELGKSYQVANALAEAEIASEIYSTAGDYDLLVKFYVESGTDIGHFVNEKVQCIPGIKDTHTIITFKAFQA